MAVYTAIDDPEAYFQVALYTGNYSTQTITLLGDTDLQPDLVWAKERDGTSSHALQDAVRGTGSKIMSNSVDAESTGETNYITSFNSDGFSIGANNGINQDGILNVAWCWKANGSGSANTDGSINTTATSANTTAGFSINQWDGSDADGTLGHGLNVAPRCIIIKNQDAAEQWYVYHESMGNGNRMVLNDTSAQSSAADWWQDTSPTTSVISLSGVDGINGDADMIAYCWHDVQGFSKFGSYLGNENADGTFVYTGFQPAFVIIKKSTVSASSWIMLDTKRDIGNPVNERLTADDPQVVSSDHVIDVLSNGFKIRDADVTINDSGETHIYMAWAEAPFVNSNGVPCNAR